MMIVVDPNGDSVVSNEKTDIAVNVSDRAYMKETLSSNKGVVSDIIVNRETGKTIVVITEPIKSNGQTKDFNSNYSI